MNIEVADAQRLFPDALRRALTGEQVVITSGGRPIAVLGPPAAPTNQPDDASATIAAQTQEIARLKKRGRRLWWLAVLGG